MKIIKKGTFDSAGMMDGWEFDLRNVPRGILIASRERDQECMMFLDTEGRVFVRGVEIVEWSEERQKAMGL